MAKKSKVHNTELTNLTTLFHVFDGDYRSCKDAALMESIDPNDKNHVFKIIYDLLIPMFNELPLEGKRRTIKRLEFLLHDKTEDFSELFNFHLQGGVFFGEDLTKTRQFVEITYDILKKELEKENH